MMKQTELTDQHGEQYDRLTTLLKEAHCNVGYWETLFQRGHRLLPEVQAEYASDNTSLRWFGPNFATKIS